MSDAQTCGSICSASMLCIVMYDENIMMSVPAVVVGFVTVDQCMVTLCTVQVKMGNMRVAFDRSTK